MLRVAASLVAAVAMACSNEGFAKDIDVLDGDAPVTTARLRADGSARRADLSALMIAAHGAPPLVCAIAAEAIGDYGWRNASGGAPKTPLEAYAYPSRGAQADIDMMESESGRGARLLSAEDVKLLMGNLSSDDLCVRDLSVRIVANDRRDETAAALAERLSAADSSVREVVTFGLGLMVRRACQLRVGTGPTS